MADITSTWGLDYSEFRRGAAGVEDAASRSAAKASREFAKTQKSILEVTKTLLGMGLAGAGIRFAADSIAAYRKSVGEAEGTTDALSASVERLQVSMGRDLASGLDGTKGILAELVDGLGTARSAAVDFTAKAMDLYMVQFGGGRRGAGESYADLGAAQAGDEASRRRSAAMRNSAKRQGAIAGAEAQARGGPGAETENAMIEEKFRHRDKLAEISAIKDAEDRKLATEDENRLSAAKIAGIQRVARERQQDKELARELAALDLEAAAADGLRLNNREKEAVFLEKDVALRKEIARIEHDRTLTPEERASRRQNAISIGAFGRDTAVAKVEMEQRKAHEASRQGITDAIEQARIQRLGIDGHQTAAELAGIRLDYEKQIRDVMKDQSLSGAEQLDASNRLAAARDSILRAAGREALEKTSGEYRSALAGRSFRSLDSGSGQSAGQVFGPAGSTESMYIAGGGRTVVEKKFDEMINAQKAVVDQMRRVEENTRPTPGVFGG